MQVIDHVLLHVIFSTKSQRAVLNEELRTKIRDSLADELSHSENIRVALAVLADHVHVAVYLSRKMTVNKLVERLKKTTTRCVRSAGAPFENFAWQQGFAAFSVGLTDRDALIRYIETQDAFHGARTFQQEMRAMYAKYDAGFDERFVWK
jgi:putative transposase